MIWASLEKIDVSVNEKSPIRGFLHSEARSVFVPLFGVILGSLAGRINVASLMQNARSAHVAPIAIWIAGIACYHLLAQFAPVLGSALPTLVLSFALARLVRA